jgi:hypothetical protein
MTVGQYLERKNSRRDHRRAVAVMPDTVGLVHRLLSASLVAWKVAGRVERDAGRLTLSAGEHTLPIERGAPPFRWRVTLDGRERGVTSIAGLLRLVRRVVDPDHQGSRLRIAPSPLVPS